MELLDYYDRTISFAHGNTLLLSQLPLTYKLKHMGAYTSGMHNISQAIQEIHFAFLCEHVSKYISSVLSKSGGNRLEIKVTSRIKRAARFQLV